MQITESIKQAALAVDGPCELRPGGYHTLVQELGSNHAADHWLRGLATALGKPIRLAEGGYIAPRGWTAEHLRAYLAGRPA